MSDPESIYRRLRSRIQEYLSSTDRMNIHEAYLFAKDAHAGQLRESGDPFIIHPLATAEYLSEMYMDAPTLIAALLHDVAEDTHVLLEDIQDLFNEEIMQLVNGVTKLKISATAASREYRNIESLEKMLVATANDVRVLLIKLADRLHNMRTLHHAPVSKQKRVALETLNIYAPLAARLGIWQVKSEMETYALKALEPEIYQDIQEAIIRQNFERQQDILNIKHLIEKKLKELKLEGNVEQLPAYPYSVFKTNKGLNRNFSDLQGFLSLAIQVPREVDCYTAIGVIHGYWKPIPGKFDDYIVTPKDNFYRSLHTTVVGPGGFILKIRVRTYDMHKQAEFGVFSHWRYQEKPGARSTPEERSTWLRQLAELSRESRGPRKFVESLMADVLPDRLFIFTPKGEMREFPIGATPLDLAYYIHTEIGHASRGARVNGELRDLRYKLQNGDRVEILTITDQQPCYEWLDPNLDFCVTERAKKAIRSWFRRLEYQVKLFQGKFLLARELAQISCSPPSFVDIAKMFDYDDIEKFLIAIGGAQLGIHEIAERILSYELKFPEREIETIGSDDFEIGGLGTFQPRFNKCCQPSRGDKIIGQVLENEIIVVHKADCHAVLKASTEHRMVALYWQQNPLQVYPIGVEIEAIEREGLLQEIATIVSSQNVNISEVHATTNKPSNGAILVLTLEIQNPGQFVRILHRIDQLPNVQKIQRIRN